MKLRRLSKNAIYLKAYGCSFKKFKKLVRTSPDIGLSRVPARKLKAIWNQHGHFYINQIHGLRFTRAVIDECE